MEESFRHRSAAVPGVPPGKWRLVKGNSVWLDPETVFILAGFQLLGQPRGQGTYLWTGWTKRTLDIDLEAAELEKRENRVQPWKFNFMPGCAGIVYGNFYQFAFHKAGWLRNRVRKAAKTWPEFVEVLEGWQVKKRKGMKTLRWPSRNAKRETSGYLDLLGNELPDLASAEEELRELPGGICYKFCYTGKNKKEGEEKKCLQKK